MAYTLKMCYRTIWRCSSFKEGMKNGLKMWLKWSFNLILPLPFPLEHHRELSLHSELDMPRRHRKYQMALLNNPKTVLAIQICIHDQFQKEVCVFTKWWGFMRRQFIIIAHIQSFSQRNDRPFYSNFLRGCMNTYVLIPNHRVARIIGFHSNYTLYRLKTLNMFLIEKSTMNAELPCFSRHSKVSSWISLILLLRAF